MPYIDQAGREVDDPHWDSFTGATVSPAQSNLLGQAEQDQAATRALMGQLAQYGQQYGQAFQTQSNLGNQLDSVIAGTAPSVAQAQLAQGVGQVRQQQDSQASGATGQNAVIARIAAMNNTGQAQAAANQHAALIRATEIQQARQQKAQIAGQQAGEAGGMYAANLSGATGFASPAVTAAGSERTAEQKDLESQRAFWSNMMNAAGKSMAGAA